MASPGVCNPGREQKKRTLRTQETIRRTPGERAGMPLLAGNRGQQGGAEGVPFGSTSPFSHHLSLVDWGSEPPAHPKFPGGTDSETEGSRTLDLDTRLQMLIKDKTANLPAFLRGSDSSEDEAATPAPPPLIAPPLTPPCPPMFTPWTPPGSWCPPSPQWNWSAPPPPGHWAPQTFATEAMVGEYQQSSPTTDGGNAEEMVLLRNRRPERWRNVTQNHGAPGHGLPLGPGGGGAGRPWARGGGPSGQQGRHGQGTILQASRPEQGSWVLWKGAWRWRWSTRETWRAQHRRLFNSSSADLT